MISRVVVVNSRDIPKEHKIDHHAKRCRSKREPAVISQDFPSYSNGYYKTLYMCLGCGRTEIVKFRKEETK